MMRKHLPLRSLYLAAALVFALAVPASAEKQAEIEYPSNEYVEDVVPEGGGLTGREIWEKFLENRIHSAVQYQTIISRDPGGGEQRSSFWIRWKDFRNDEREANEDGVLGKTLIKFYNPADMRHTGFLMIVKEGGYQDQFVYTPSSRRVKRVNLRDVSVMGSDLSFDDIAFQDIEDANYTRLENEVFAGTPVYVVKAVVKPELDSAYSKTIAYFEKEHYVPLRARYWDHADIEVKEMKAESESIREFNGVWLATNSTMHNLKRNTESVLLVEKLDPNIEIAENLFSTFRLQLRRQ
jgi:hypothetical protein